MATTDETLVQPGEVLTDGEAVREAAGMSWIQDVRRRRDERVEDEALKLGVPTWGEDDIYDLVAEFQVIPRAELVEFTRQQRSNQRKNKTGESDADIAFLVRSCTGVYIRRPDTQRLVKMEKPEGVPVKLDKRLGELLGLSDEDNRNSRTLLLYLVKNNGVALGSMAAKVARWMQDTSVLVDGEVLGE